MPVKETLLDAKGETVARRVRGLPLLQTAIKEAFGGGGGYQVPFLSLVANVEWLDCMAVTISCWTVRWEGGPGGNLSLKATVEDEAQLIGSK